MIGGLCIGCEWTGETVQGQPALARYGGRDRRTRGRRARPGLRADLGVAGGAVHADDVAGRVTPMGDAEVRVIGGEPGRERAYRVIELLAAGSIERLWITDAYLVAPPRLFQALRDAARDGVDVRMLVPGSSDLPLIRNLSRIGYRELLRSGVRIFEWDGPMLHAKTLVADGRWVRVGSSNLNPSSLLGNYELDVLVEDPSLAEAMERPVPAGRRAEPRGHPAAGAGAPADQRRAAHGAEPRAARGAGRGGAGGAGGRSASARRSRSGPSRPTRGGRCSCRSARSSWHSACCSSRCPRRRPTPSAALCAWLAIGAWREAFRRRADR